MKHKLKILELRKLGKTYQEIVDILGCSKSTVCFHIGDNQKEKNRIRNLKNKKSSLKTILCNKLQNFFHQHKTPTREYLTNKTIQDIIYKKTHTFLGKTMNFNTQDIIDKFGPNPCCYLTGEPIDLTKSKTYHFDHIIPRSKGGTNTLDNLGLTTSMSNLTKNKFTVEEYIEQCKKVLIHHGYKVEK